MTKEEQKFYDTKSELTSLLTDFIKLCIEDGRDAECEIDDCVADAVKDSK